MDWVNRESQRCHPRDQCISRCKHVVCDMANEHRAESVEQNVDDVVASHVQTVQRKIHAKGKHRQRAVALHTGWLCERPSPEVVHEEVADWRLRPQISVRANGRTIVDDEFAIDRVGVNQTSKGEAANAEPRRLAPWQWSAFRH